MNNSALSGSVPACSFTCAA